jgi:hypothetical protein
MNNQQLLENLRMLYEICKMADINNYVIHGSAALCIHLLPLDKEDWKIWYRRFVKKFFEA